MRRRREALTSYLDLAVEAVEPELLTRRALTNHQRGPATLIAIGKAAAAMCRGAAGALGEIGGICVTDAKGHVPDGVELVVGDHPVPGDRSFDAGRRVLEVAATAEHDIIALISGGGSALCEQPREGIPAAHIRHVNQALLAAGASIEETNLVRRHLSAIKNGGVARQAQRPLDTFLISDVCGADPAVISSGPTIHRPEDPESALAVLDAHGIEVPDLVRTTIRGEVGEPPDEGRVTVIGDGHTAARAVAGAAHAEGVTARIAEGWISGDVVSALDRFFSAARPGLTIAAGEPDVPVSGNGRGGRNTHAAVLAARRIAGSDAVFAAFATDGVDGSSGSAGAIVDGTTLENGGDPTAALESSDSAGYLETTSSLLPGGPTGTNVSDLWVLWK